MSDKKQVSLRILFIASEADPFIKIGGLGDYAGSLPKAISGLSATQEKNIDIRVALPFHGNVKKFAAKMTKLCTIKVKSRSGFSSAIVYQLDYQGIIHYFIKRMGNSSGYADVYNTAQIYDSRKYIFFSLACLELAKAINWSPDIIHANDWHTAISVYELGNLKKSERFFKSTRSLITIHNMPFIGEGSQPVIKEYQLSPVTTKLIPVWARNLPLPMGLDKADEIVAVSPTYAQELKQEEFGDGFADFFVHNSHKTTGILNGIDTNVWNPLTDNHLVQKYAISDIEKRLINKKALLNDYGLDHNLNKPLLVLISRLTLQKGIDILLQGLLLLMSKDWAAIFLGTGQYELERGIKALESEIPDRFKAVFEFNNRLAHRLYASGDILLMPSSYEPCGLSQMIGMRYGCVPVARAVGGLKDSITAEPDNLKTGYLFEKADGLSFANCLKSAISDFHNKKKWKLIQNNAMSVDFSWEKSARQYLNLYYKILANNGEVEH